MKRISLEEIDKTIQENKKRVNNEIRLNSSLVRRKKSRTRSQSEIIALNEIAIARWNKAIETGKIKRLGKRHLYYDYN
jgi:NAD kinase